MITKIIAFENEAQRVLFEKEIRGQLSDGFWENAKPYDHWRSWSSATAVVHPDKIGRNFYARKDNYNLTSKELLDIIGERMVHLVRRNTDDINYDMAALKKDLKRMKEIFRTYCDF